MNYLYYIGYAYTVYVAKQNPVKGFGETNIIRDHELTTADIVELQQSLGKNLIVNNHLQAVQIREKKIARLSRRVPKGSKLKTRITNAWSQEEIDLCSL